MRMSCNGCRVLRKGCNEKCIIKPCLEWIKSPDSQSNATLFLAKFYGRAGLLNLINAAPHNLRPATFRSLLYESCGRMLNPIYGSVGLLWSGQWHLCQAAVEAVLKGAPITPIPTETASIPPSVKGAYDIRHVTKDETSKSAKPNRAAFKRSGGVLKPKASKLSSVTAAAAAALATMGSSTSHHDSSMSHSDDAATTDSNSNNSCMVSVDTMEGDVAERDNGGSGLELELTLGIGVSKLKSCMVREGNEKGVCKMELGIV